MLPAAVLEVLVQARGVRETQAQLQSVNSTLAKTESATTRAGQSMVALGTKTEKVGKAMTKYIATPLLGLGVAAGVMSAKFNRSMNLIATDAGGSAREVKYLSKEVLGLAEHSEFGPQKLADSLFFIESAGVRGAKAIHVLDQVQRAAMAGNAGLEEAVFGTVGAMNALGEGAGKVEKILATMNSVVGHGHLRLDELTKAMSTGTVGVAKTFGLTFEGFGSALAFFTRMSEPAQQAATRMRQTLTHLATSPTEKAAEALDRVGISVDVMSKKMEETGRLGPVIAILAKHMKEVNPQEKNQILTEAFGGGRYGTQIREAISNVELLLKTEKEVASKATIKRLRHSEVLQEESDAVKLKKAWSSVEANLVRLGDTILPVVVPILQKIAASVGDVATWFGQLNPSTQKFIVYAGLLLIAVSLVLRVFGGMIKSMGEIVIWFGKAGEANVALAESNTMVAESYQAVAISALEARHSMEDQYGAYAGGRMADKVGLPMETDLAPSLKQNVGTAFRSLTKGLPGMFAAYGIGNIITSLISGDMKDAGAEGAGALVGGLAAFLSGNPELVGVGVGVGSLLGEVISHAIGSSVSLTPMQKQMKASAQQVANAMKNQADSASNLSDVQENLKEVNQKVKHSGKELAVAEEHLHEVRDAHGGLKQTIAAEDKYFTTFRRHTIALHDRQSALENLHFAEHVHGRAIGEVVHTAAIGKNVEEAHLTHLHERAKKEGITPEISEKSNKALRNISKYVKDYNEAIAAARRRNKDWAASLEQLSGLQNRFGASGRGLRKSIHDQTSAVRELQERAALPTSSPLDHMELRKGQHKLEALEEQYSKVKDSIVGSMTTAEKESTLVALKVAEGISHPMKGLGGVVKVALEGLSGGFKHFSPHINLKPAHSELGKLSTHLSEAKTHAENLSGTMTKTMKPKVDSVFQDTSSKATWWSGIVLGALGGVNSEAAHMVEAWGGKAPVHAATGKHHEVVKKARGGFLPGVRTGDKIPAMLEDGEYIFNKEAVKAVGKHNLDAINFGAAPRFAEGGAVMKAMNEARAIEGTPYVWGGGHSAFTTSGGLDCSGAVSLILHAAGLLGKPMTSGSLMNWGLPGPGPLTVFANPDHAWMSIEGRPYGTSVNDSSKGLNFYPQPSAAYKAGFTVRHADVAAAGILGAGGAPQLKDRTITGTGTLARLGNEQVHKTTEVMQSYLDKHSPGEWGGGNINVAAGNLGGPELAQLWKWAKGPMQVAHEASAIALAESGGDPKAHNPSGATGLWQILGSLVPGNLYDPKVNALNAVAKYHTALGGDNFSPWEAWTNSAYKQFMAAGGEAKAGGKTVAELHKISKGFSHAIKQVKAGQVPKGYSGIRKGVRKLGKVEGLSSNMIKNLVQDTEMVAQRQEYATSASNRNYPEEFKNARGEEETKTIFGLFHGKDEGYWEVSQLEGLEALRNQLLAARKAIKGPKKAIGKMVKKFKAAMHKAEKHVRELKRQEKKLEEQKEEIEKAEKLGLRKLEQEKNTWENTLNKLQGAKNPNKEPVHGEIVAAHEKIKQLNGAMQDVRGKGNSGLDKTQKEITSTKKQLNATEKDVTGYQKFVPELEAKRTAIGETSQGIMAGFTVAEGPFKNKQWSGIQEVQGRVNNYAPAKLEKEPGPFAGEIEAVQLALKSYSEVNKPPAVGAGGVTQAQEEMKEIENEIGLEWKKRFLVGQYQQSVLRGFPTVNEVAGVPSGIPYAGEFALGGSVLAKVGERGPEYVVTPNGSRVVTEADASRAVKGAGSTTLVIEEFNVHSDGTVEVKANGEMLETEIKRTNKKQSRRSSAITPGGLPG